MTSIQHAQNLTAISLRYNCIYLAASRAIHSYTKTAEFFRTASTDPELMNGRMLALHNVKTSQDVHYPNWEMHPEGDELLILTSGLISVEFRDKVAERTIPLPPLSAFIVPTRFWHRLVVPEPSELISIPFSTIPFMKGGSDRSFEAVASFLIARVERWNQHSLPDVHLRRRENHSEPPNRPTQPEYQGF